MITRVLLAAIIAGMIAGAVAASIQMWRVTPLIIAAEVYESQPDTSAAHSHGATEKGAHQHVHDADVWAPEDGLERTAYTFLTNLIMGVAFAFVLAAAVMFSGRTITIQNGFVWGGVGFLVFTLAPAVGMAPELPGMPTADLIARQTWWWGTAIATASGIAVIVLAKPLAVKALGTVPIALPHIIGAPHPESHDSAVPATLAADFAANSLATMMLFWIVLGVSMGWAMSRPDTQAGG